MSTDAAKAAQAAKATTAKATQAANATKAAKAAKVASAAVGKAGSGLAVGLGKSVLGKGAIVGAFAARRAAWPAVVVGTAFGGAAWFGVFEMATGVAERYGRGDEC